MPTRTAVGRFVEMVEAGKFIDAMECFYSPRATAQENNDPPRVGLEALLEQERRTLAAFGNVDAKCVRPILIDGAQVVIHWIFTFTRSSGASLRLEELALQIWDEERVVSERFFYDSRQLRP